MYCMQHTRVHTHVHCIGPQCIGSSIPSDTAVCQPLTLPLVNFPAASPVAPLHVAAAAAARHWSKEAKLWLVLASARQQVAAHLAAAGFVLQQEGQGEGQRWGWAGQPAGRGCKSKVSGL